MSKDNTEFRLGIRAAIAITFVMAILWFGYLAVMSILGVKDEKRGTLQPSPNTTKSELKGEGKENLPESIKRQIETGRELVRDEEGEITLDSISGFLADQTSIEEKIRRLAVGHYLVIQDAATEEKNSYEQREKALKLLKTIAHLEISNPILWDRQQGISRWRPFPSVRNGLAYHILCEDVIRKFGENSREGKLAAETMNGIRDEYMKPKK